MKHTYYIYIGIALTTLALLTSCHSDDIASPTYTVGEADNAITLRAGISEGGNGVITRAGEDAHVPFTAQTQLRLRVDGTWTGHDPETVSHTTTAKTVASATDKIDGETNDKHAVEFTATETLYWDDYGTADPANASTGRTDGLTIYGVAVEGKATLPTTPTNLTSNDLNWTSLAWNVGTLSDSKVSQASGWDAYDLIYSNNIKGDGKKYTFTNATASPKVNNLLEFTHAMTKVTVNLTAGQGFPGYTDAPDNAKFVNAPVVTLLSFNYTGTVNVETKTPSASTTTNIVAYRDNGTEWTTGGQHTSGFTALVFPGNQFSDETNIIKIEVDGNTYYVNATEINKVNTETNNTFEQAKNYVFNITINKTPIVTSATILDWSTVEAAMETPKINVDETYGHDGTAFAHDFDFFRSTTKASNYSNDAYVAYTAGTPATYTFHNQLYWPDHSTHYFFRGVFPRVQTASEDGWIPNAKVSTSAISVQNAPYVPSTYPSDLALGWPKTVDSEGKETGDDEICKVHTSSKTQGICATEGTIRMNFNYVMSQVEVRLKSTATGDGHIAMTKDNTIIEIIDGYNNAQIRLSDGLHENYTNDNKGYYTLTNLTTAESGYLVTSKDAIVPQVIGNDVLFRITYTNDNGTPDDTSDDHNDIYQCKVNLIKETATTTAINEWKPGRHYIYVLDINKTAISTTATITDWVKIEASDNVWF